MAKTYKSQALAANAIADLKNHFKYVSDMLFDTDESPYFYVDQTAGVFPPPAGDICALVKFTGIQPVGTDSLGLVQMAASPHIAQIVMGAALDDPNKFVLFNEIGKWGAQTELYLAPAAPATADIVPANLVMSWDGPSEKWKILSST